MIICEMFQRSHRIILIQKNEKDSELNINLKFVNLDLKHVFNHNTKNKKEKNRVQICTYSVP